MPKYYTILDINDLIAPLYLILIIIISLLLKVKKTKGQPHIRKYFMPALYLRLMGCILSALMYQYYYGTGDTAGYFCGTRAVWDAFWHHPAIAFEIWGGTPESLSDPAKYLFIEHDTSYFWRATNSLMVIKIGGLISLFTFKSYLAIGFVLAFFSFLGCWKLFEVFNSEYPHLHKQIAMATLFIPSLFFWGAAGLTKDTITMAAVGYIVWGVYYLFIKKKKRWIALFYTILAFYLILVIKEYIILALAPSLLFWIFLKTFLKIKNKSLRRLVFPIITSIAFLATGITLKVMMENSQRFQSGQLIKRVEDMQWWHKLKTDMSGGASYDLGEWSPTIGGIANIIPKAINVSLFRPYPWEAKKLILIPAVLESLFTLLLTLYVLFKVNIFRIIQKLFEDPNLLFCLVFSLTFAFAIGFTSYNFGALIRYKIPCLPFYFLTLFILLSKSKKKKVKHYTTSKFP